MKELENRDWSLNISKSNHSRKAMFFFGLIICLWGAGLILIFLAGSEVLIPQITALVYLFAFSLFVGGIKMMLLSNSSARGNTAFNYYSHLNSIMMNNILPTIAMLNFVLMFVLAGIFRSFPFLIIGSVFLFLFLFGIIKGTKEYLRKRKIAEPFGISKIEIMNFPTSKLEGKLILEFINPTPLLEQVPLDFTLRYLKERNVKTKKGNKTKSKFTTFIHFEKKEEIILKNGKAVAEFTLPQEDFLYTNLDFKEPDYWELEVSEKETGLFTRFVLENLNN